MRFAHPTGLSRYPLPKSLPSGEGLAFTASSEEKWCFANAKLESNIHQIRHRIVTLFRNMSYLSRWKPQKERLGMFDADR